MVPPSASRFPFLPARSLSRRRFLALSAQGALLALCGASLAGCTDIANDENAASDEATAKETAASEAITRTSFAFDTVITLTAYCSEELMDAAVERCGYFESIFSRTIRGSDVWNVNQAGGAPVDVAPETIEILGQALKYSEASDGLFDVTIGAVSSLWDFKNGVKPDDDEIAAALEHVNWRGVSVDESTVRLADPEAMIDLGGIAKGYIADDLARLLREGGCESAIVNLGGNVLVIGAKPDGSDWNVGIQDPNALTGSATIASLACMDRSVVTSGLYERSFTLDGTRYHHILDPRTGYPAKTDLDSVSIASNASIDGDAMATWMLILGADEALARANSADAENLDMLIVRQDGSVEASDGAPFVLR